MKKDVAGELVHVMAHQTVRSLETIFTYQGIQYREHSRPGRENLEGNHSPISKSWVLNSSGEFFLSIVDNGRHFDFAMWTSDHRQELFAENVNFATDNWYHLAATYDGKRMTLFVDGENVGCENASGSLARTGQPLRVGRNGRIPWWWVGDIDEVRIYNHALSPGEVLDLYGEAVVTDNTPPSSSVLPFEGDDYWKKVKNLESDSFTVKAGAFDDVGVENVELWYRCSLDNWTDDVVWKKRGWQRYGVDTDNTDGWSWNFTPKRYGYYEFYSVATDAAGNRENAPEREWVQSTRENFEAGELENLVIENSQTGVKLAPRVVYEDDFENYEVGEFPSAENWELVWGRVENISVTDQGFVSGGQSFRVSAVGGIPAMVQRPVPRDVDLLGYEVWVMVERGDNIGLGFFKNRDRLAYYAFLNFWIDGNMWFDGQAIQPYEPDTWYRIKVIIDKVTGRANIWVNDNLMPQVAEVSNADEIESFCLSNWLQGSYLQIDDIRLFAGYTPSGKLTSPVHDAGGWADWGKISWDETLPQGTEIAFQTRTSPDNVTWSGWSGNYTDPTGENITSPSARYIQYRATLETDNLSLTPTLHEVRITWPVADAGVRVAEDVVRVAVILAEPNDVAFYPNNWRYTSGGQTWPIDSTHDQEYFGDISENLVSYYDEVSYGVLAIDAEIFGPYVIGSGMETYMRRWEEGGVKNAEYTVDFLKQAIDAADSQISYGRYQTVVVLGAALQPPMFFGRLNSNDANRRFRAQYGWGGWPWEAGTDYTTKSGEVAKNIIRVYEWDPVGTWAHEMGHALGKILVSDSLPDLYPGGKGKIDDWGLMGWGSGGWTISTQRYFSWDPVHLSSWSKERLGWLNYDKEDLTLTEEYYVTSRELVALPNLSYGDNVYIYKIDRVDEWWCGWGKDVWYLLEARTTDARYSNWDTSVPNNNLVVYQIEYGWEWWVKPWVSVNVVGQLGVGEENSYDLGKGVRFSANSFDFGDNFVIEYTVDYPLESGSTTTTLYPMTPYKLAENMALQGDSSCAPDLDLHAFTPDGKHVGMNYETGAYEIEIPGAIASGDLQNGSEWIFVPRGTEVYFTVSSHDVAGYLENFPNGIENENGLYALTLTHFNENGERQDSMTIGQDILPGVEFFHPIDVAQNPDGTYSLDIEWGMDVLSLEAWQAAIDNIPDNVFIRNSAQRKQALKEKFGDVFEEISSGGEDEEDEDEDEDGGEVEELIEGYQEAIDKLEHDILKKLDADGKADWVRKPTLVDELKAFISVLSYRGAQNGG